MKKYYPYIIIIISGLLAVFLGSKSGFLFGSTVDWLNQHTVYPDYFRNLFYETGNIFPNLAQHLGAGQNIFHFAYYGLFNPIILVSYLLPMVSMVDYLVVSSIIMYILSGCICYKWLSKHYKSLNSLYGSLFFLFAVPLLFHAHRHLMFVSYMPFLMLGLIGIDRHFEKKSLLLILAVFLMILTSYYYSVGGLVVLSIYAIYRYLTITENVNIKSFFLAAFRFLIPIVLGILLSSLLLFPVIGVMLSNHTRVNDTVSVATLLIPKLNLGGILYGSYAIGLTGISIFAVIYALTTKKKESIFLAVMLCIILSFPLFRYLLNGALYIKNKSLIPFIPLFVLLIAEFLEGYRVEVKRTRLTVVLVLVLAFYFLFLGGRFQKYYFDFLGTIALLYLSIKFKKTYLLAIPLIIGSFSLTVMTSRTDSFVSKTAYQEYTSSAVEKWMLKSKKDHSRLANLQSTGENINRLYPSYGTSIYSSTYNLDYHQFFKETMSLAMPHRNMFMNGSSNNYLFETYMGIQYLISDFNVGGGYQKIDEKNGLALYKNNSVYPIGYSRTKRISQDDYENLSDLDRMTALFEGVITTDGDEPTLFGDDYNISLEQLDSLVVTKSDKGLKIEVDKETTVELPLSKKLENKILLLQFDVLEKPSCSDGDISIIINNESNKLTCREWGYNNENTTFHYVISEDEIDHLKITFSKGIFYLDNIIAKTIDRAKISSTISELDAWNIDVKKSEGDSIVGTINVTADGYFATSIPYDSGFKAYIDGVEVDVEKVNTAFLGFKINTGKHIVKLVYEAPYFNLGKYISLVTLIISLIWLYSEKNKRNSLEYEKENV